MPENIGTPRDGKTVYIGSSWKNVNYVDFRGDEKTVCMRMCYEVTERTVDKYGQIVLVPDIELNLFWTNTDFTDDALIELYHNHGESKRFHSEIKTDMDAERLPGGKFDTNKLVIELTILAYNILRMMGQISLNSNSSPDTKHPIKRRLRTVINNLILIAGHVTTYSRKLLFLLRRYNVWRLSFLDLFTYFVMP